MVLGRMRSTFLFAIVSSFFVFTQPAKAAKMKLLMPQVGWVLHSPGLMWTTDGGVHWNNITPRLANGQHVASVFFLNMQDGWALLSGPGEKGSDEPRFDLAVTNNAGSKWSIVPVVISDVNPRQFILDGSGQVDFVDPMHGWLNLDVTSSPNFRSAILIETDDGGETWSRPPRAPGVAGDLRFINGTDGWLAGGPGDQFLYVTHDGSKSWKKVSLGPPPQVGRAVNPTFAGAPVFVDSKLGFVAVNYSGPSGAASKLVVYTTGDTGRTWIPAKVLNESREMSVGQMSSVAITDSILVVPTGSSSRPRAATVPLTDGLGSSVVVSPFALGEISFADRSHGWAMADRFTLLSTTDGGNSWTEITPHPPQKPFPPAKPPKWRSIDPLTGRPTTDGKPQTAAPSGALGTQPLSSLSESSLTVAPSAPNGSVHTSVHLGFHTCSAPSPGDMSISWTYSPYYDAGIYIGGGSRSCPNSNLTSTWITQVEAQGWGLMPLWAGPQAPCACRPGYPDCTPFPDTFSTSAAAAEVQGEQEAQSAGNAASQLGLSGSVIYYDLENYDSSNCGEAAKAFVEGWVTGLHGYNKSYSAGVYGSPYDASPDWSGASPMPDEVWIAKDDGRATIWGLAGTGSLDDSLWSSSQRIRQYMLANEEYGGVPINVDDDIEDAPVGGSNGTKAGTFVVNSFLTGLYFPLGINDAVSNGTGVTFTYSEGQVAGVYTLDTAYGFLWDPNVGFIQAPITYGAFTEGWDVNNLGQVVGDWNDFDSGYVFTYHGLVFQNGSYASYDYPGTIGGTNFRGVNDDGEMVGYYEDQNENYHAFLLPSLVDLPQDITIQGAISIVARGINGAGQIVGGYEDTHGNTHGFFYDPHSGSAPETIDCKGSAITVLSKINNNQQIVGYCNNYSTMFVYDYVHRSFKNIPFSATDLLLSGINDGEQGVGYAWDPSSSVWVPFTVTETH